MEKMGFSQKWLGMIYNCISTTTFQILINGHLGQKFKAERDLRQGGPLSPYLFLMCAEGLSARLSTLENANRI